MADKIKILKKGTDEHKTWRVARRKKRKEKEAKAFKEIVDKVKKEKSKEELMEVVSRQPYNYELADFFAARKALDEMGVSYSKAFK